MLADHIVFLGVEGRAAIICLLHVGLNRVVPEALKLRNIAITAAVSAPEATANDAGATAQVAEIEPLQEFDR